MNFAERILEENKSKKNDKWFFESYDNWEKAITPGAITKVLIDFARENSETPELGMMAMHLNIELLKALFPPEEFKKNYKEQKGAE